MKPDSRFLDLPKSFWAFVRLIGQECGYTKRGAGELLVPSREVVEGKMKALNISPDSLEVVMSSGEELWTKLVEYFEYRADLLRKHVEPNLMTAEQAKKEFVSLKKTLKSKRTPTMNKQKGKMKTPAYLTCMVDMLIESVVGKRDCNYDPHALITVTRNGIPLRTFARRMDGAFPSVLNPIAVWEIKEYYYTTTFGSRVADGVYESLLDGMEIEELATTENIDILHYLIIDAHYTWWKCGKSYLCRIVDMMHMGYVDEVLIGREVLTRLPEIAKEWMK